MVPDVSVLSLTHALGGRWVTAIVSIDKSPPLCGRTVTYLLADTSLAFSYIERILRSQDPDLAVASALTAIDATLTTLQAAGFDPMVVSGGWFVGMTFGTYMKHSTTTLPIFSNL